MNMPQGRMLGIIRTNVFQAMLCTLFSLLAASPGGFTAQLFLFHETSSPSSAWLLKRSDWAAGVVSLLSLLVPCASEREPIFSRDF